MTQPHEPTADQLLQAAIERGVITPDDADAICERQDLLGRSGRPASLYEAATQSLSAAKLSELKALHFGGSRPRPSSATQARPRQLGAYIIVEELARGAMGVVYRGLHPQLGRQVAIKQLIPREGRREHDAQRFRIEAHAAARLRHPNIVTIHDVGEQGGLPFLVLDLLERGSLADRVAREGPLEPRLAAEIMKRLAEAVYYAHTRSVLHRDIKPDNVLLSDTGDPVLTDFGLAKDLEQGVNLTGAGRILGTPNYMPPEQAQGKLHKVDRRSDVYSLGATLYELLTGAPPFEGESLVEIVSDVIHTAPPAPSERCSDLPIDLEQIVLMALEKDPLDRYQSAQDLADDLQRFLMGRPVIAHPPTPGERLTRWARSNRRAAGLIVACLPLMVLVVVGALLWMQRVRTRGALSELRAREEARGGAERRLAASARAASLEAAKRLTEARGIDARTGLALASLQEATRWRALTPGDPRAAQAVFEAAWILGVVSRDSQQWALATQAFTQAQGLGIDDERTRQAVREVGALRTADAQRKRAEITGLLEWVESGRLPEDGADLRDIALEILRYREPQTVQLLTERLAAITRRLAKARDALSEAPRAATPRGQALAHLARRQRQEVGQASLLTARLACEVLGRLGDPRSAGPLSDYLRAEADELRAVPAGLALCRLGGDLALDAVEAARRRYGLGGPFDSRISRLLRGSGPVEAEQASTAGYTQAGRRALERGDAARAREFFQKAIALSEDCAPAWSGLGSANRALGELDRAMAAYDRALSLEPDRAATWNLRAQARQDAGDTQGALKDLGQAIALDEDDSSGWNNRGALLLSLGNAAQAAQDFDRALKRSPRDARLWTNRGNAHRMLGDRRAALRDYTKALELDPGRAGAWENRGLLKQEAGDLQGAVGDLEQALRLDPDDPRLWGSRGAAHAALGDLEAARQDLDQALKLDPQDNFALVQRAYVRKATRDLKGAIRDLDRALEVDPRDADALSQRGLTKQAARDFEGAVSDLEAATVLRPLASSTWLNLGVARLVSGEPKLAILDLDRALALDAKLGRAWLSRGVAKRTLRDMKGALADLKRATQQGPEDARAWSELGRTHLASRAPEAALEAFDKAIAIDDGYAPTWSYRALAEQAAGNVRGAIDDCTKAITLAPRLASAWRVRGVLRAREGLPGATEDLERFLQIAPRDRRATAVRELIEELNSH